MLAPLQESGEYSRQPEPTGEGLIRPVEGWPEVKYMIKYGEFERRFIRKRTLAGLSAAMAKGRNEGRPKIPKDGCIIKNNIYGILRF